jgi:hypothetical protein
MTAPDYNDDQQALALEAAQKLRRMAERMRGFMAPHAVTQAFLSIAVDSAGMHMTRDQLADWLHGVADELAASARVH